MAQSNRLGGSIRGSSYLGTNANNPSNVSYAKRDPTTDDVAGYVPGDIWINTIGSTAFILASVIATVDTNGEQQATWLQIAGSSGGAVNLIQTQTASSVTALNFTTGISATYTNYMLIINKLSCATAATTDAFVQLSVNGGSSYITSGYRNNASVDNGLQITNVTDGSSLCYGEMYLYNIPSALGYISSNSMMTVANIGSTSFDGSANASYESANILVNAIRIVMANGGAFSGIFSLYSISQ